MVSKAQGKENKEVAPVSLPAELVEGVDSYASAIRLLTEQLGAENVSTATDDLGDGFPICDDKEKLVGQPLVFMDWEFYISDKVPSPKEGEELWPGRGMFTSARVVTQDGRKFRVNDGSRGMHSQLWLFSQKKGRQAGLVAQGGLKRSDYTNDDGIEGTTFYIDTAA